jgi:hypothetical protein
MMFENTWLARYLKPEQCIHDNGGKFIGVNFIHILTVCGVMDVPTMLKYLQAYEFCEQMHQSAGNVKRTLTHVHPPQNMMQANHIVDSALATTMHAIQCAMHKALGMSPGAFVFQ